MANKNPHDGSSFESFLKEEGVLDETRQRALAAVRAWQRAEADPTAPRNQIKTCRPRT
jgi:hypothetical protein